MGGTFPGRAGVPKAGHFPTTSHRMPMNGMATSKSENATLNSARSLGAPFATCYYMKPNMASGTRATPRTCLARSSIRKKLRAANASRIPHRIGMYIYPRQSAHRWRRAVKKSTPLHGPFEPIPIVFPLSFASIASNIRNRRYIRFARTGYGHTVPPAE